MDIRNSFEGLRSLLGVNTVEPMTTQVRSRMPAEPGPLTSDKATLSSAGSEVALTAADSDVRMSKVASIQAALQAGTYNVPASAVASKMVDAMLGANQ